MCLAAGVVWMRAWKKVFPSNCRRLFVDDMQILFLFYLYASKAIGRSDNFTGHDHVICSDFTFYDEGESRINTSIAET